MACMGCRAYRDYVGLCTEQFSVSSFGCQGFASNAHQHPVFLRVSAPCMF